MSLERKPYLKAAPPRVKGSGPPIAGDKAAARAGEQDRENARPPETYLEALMSATPTPGYYPGYPPPQQPPGPRPRHALGLPAGSIRGLLALGVLGYLWLLVLRGGPQGTPPLASKEVSLAFIYLQFLMVLILAHFFTAHGHSIGRHVSDRSPLGLPSGSIRFLLLAGYLGLAFYLYHTKPEFVPPPTGPIIIMLMVLGTAFFLGYLMTTLMRWLGGGFLPPWFQDIQAWVAILALLVLGVIVVVRMVINTSLPLENQIDLPITEAFLAGLVGFYFGARS